MSSTAINPDQTLKNAYGFNDQTPATGEKKINEFRFVGTCDDILAGTVETTEEVYLIALSSKVEPLRQAIARIELRISNFDNQVSVSSSQHPEIPVGTIFSKLSEYLLDDAKKFDRKIEKLKATYPKAEPLFEGKDMRLKEIIGNINRFLLPVSPSFLEPSSSETPIIRTVLEIACLIGPSDKLFLRAHVPEQGLTWDKGIELTKTPEGTYSFNVDADEDFEFKVLVNDWNWSAGPNMIAKSNQSITFTPTFEHPI
ncbi:MAG: hypothetical protein JSR57_03590 [Verrucomicrobia bacterium]|nr:hypothetical protein [Verrucomicrobiota bacterium]